MSGCACTHAYKVSCDTDQLLCPRCSAETQPSLHEALSQFSDVAYWCGWGAHDAPYAVINRVCTSLPHLCSIWNWKKTVGSMWSCFGVRVPGTLDYPTVKQQCIYRPTAIFSHTENMKDSSYNTALGLSKNHRPLKLADNTNLCQCQR